MKYKQFIALFVIGLTIAGQLAGVIYLPSLPAMQIYFNSDESSVKLVLILYLLGFGISQLFFGPYSDQKGRKSALLLGLMLSLIGNFICSIATNLSILNLSRILVGLGSGATASIGRAILRDIFNDKKSLIAATSTIGMVTALTPAIGPVIGGFIQQFTHWRYNFLLLTLYILTISLVCAIMFKESNYNQARKLGPIHVMRGFKDVLQCPLFNISVLCASIAFSGLIAYEISAPFLFENIIGLSPSTFGLISFCLAGSLSLGSFTNKRFSSYTSRQRLKFASILFVISAILLLSLSSTLSANILSVLLPSMLFASGVGIIFPTDIADALTPFTTNAGSASALFGFSQMILTMLVNLGFSLIKVKSGIPLATTFLFCGITIFLLANRIKYNSQSIE